MVATTIIASCNRLASQYGRCEIRDAAVSSLINRSRPKLLTPAHVLRFEGKLQNVRLLTTPGARMSDRCLECGAPVPQGGSCRAHFDALLALEWQIPGGPGELSHFFAVGTYGRQHPRQMNYTTEAVVSLRAAVVDALEGRASIEELLRRARHGAENAGRVTRRRADAAMAWRIFHWPMTVVDVLDAMESLDSYTQCVSKWARSVIEELDAHHPMD